ncbi:hypothetical protein [Halopseudomonas nanhaiensis]|nr:hypothetical protein [Halopseudomonas nanhaiensis]
MSAEGALLRIQEILSGREWSAETPAEIAQVMEAAGYEIEDID